jgi:hypothetical protein
MINGHSLNGSSRHLLGALKLAIRHGVLVMLAMDDIDRRFRGPLRSTWSIATVDDPGLAYAYTEVKAPRIVPSPRDITRAEIVDSWLVWLRAEEGKRAVHRVFHWARGVPLWVQAQREGCSERTIINRIDRSMAAILREFLDVETDVAPVEEPATLPVRHYHAAWEATTGDAGTREAFGKIYIDGIGFMKDGRRLRDGREKAEDRKLYRDRPR